MITSLVTKPYIMKTLNHKFLCFTIRIYSEDRTGYGELYKHFLDIKFFGIRVFHTFWKTGGDDDGSFYVLTLTKEGDCGFGEIKKFEL